MQFDDSSAHGEPETGARPAAGLFRTMELLEDAFFFTGSEADAMIGDRNKKLIITNSGSDFDYFLHGRVLGGIFQQIEQYLLQENAIRSYQGEISR